MVIDVTNTGPPACRMILTHPDYSKNILNFYFFFLSIVVLNFLDNIFFVFFNHARSYFRISTFKYGGIIYTSIH